MLTIEEALALVRSGQAMPALERFIVSTLQESGRALYEDPETPGDDDALIAAVALGEMLAAPGARAALGLKRKPRGDAYDPKYFYENKVVILAVRDYRRKRRALADTLTVIDHACEKLFGKRLNQNTLQHILKDLTGYVADLESAYENYIRQFQSARLEAGQPDEVSFEARVDELFLAIGER